LLAGNVSEFFGKSLCRFPHHDIIVYVPIDGLLAVPAESDLWHKGILDSVISDTGDGKTCTV